jgi:hypothetical protein
MTRGLVCLLCCLMLWSCGTSGSPDLPSDGQPNLPGYISWAGSDNMTWVFDALGNPYQFSGSTGCIYLPVYGNSGNGLCLNIATPTAYATWGRTHCGYSLQLPYCDTDNFAVYLTADPRNPPNCMAVLGTSNNTGSTITGKALSVYPSGGTNALFDVVLTTPTTYSAYWDKSIPICGGSSKFAGTYLGTATYSSSQNSGTCPMGQSQLPLQLTVDSGGVLNSDELQISGAIDIDGTGSFTQSARGLNQCGDGTFAISSIAQTSEGKWVLSGANFTLTQQ